MAVVLAVSLGGIEDTALVLGPLATFTLPAIAMVAFWWEDWPGRSLRAGWAGLTDTLLVAAAGILLTLLGQAVVTGLDLRGVFLADPGPGHAVTYPATMPLAGAAFAVMLQLTLVTEGWPQRRLGRIWAGIAALAVSWALALAAWVLLVDPGPLAGLDRETLGVWLIVLGMWQVVFFVVLHGRPFTRITGRAWRLTSANGAVLVITAVSYPALRLAGLEPGRVGALGGTVVAAGLVVAMLFDGWPGSRWRAPIGDAVVLVTVAVLASVLYWVLAAVAAARDWHRMTEQSWIALAALNFVGMVVILHVAVWRRWPVRTPEVTDAA
ncbi:hypothetical protein [Actinoplanes sp. NPDC089786]|uniref:hypothetical protein n=1 Tax=Actinoplanes sp. NPDC089786 TaxID=3155185 RepID=UPI00343D7D76